MAPPSTMVSWLIALTLPLCCFAGSGMHQRTVRMAIKNVKHGEYLFASKTLLDSHRRHVLTWIPGFDARIDPSGQWDVTFMPNGRALIWNVKYREPLFAGHSDVLDRKRRRALTWRNTKQYLYHPWEVRFLGSRVATLKSAQYGEYLFAGVKKLDLLRRYALTWIPGFDASRDKTGQWYMEPIHHGHASALDDVANQSIASAGNETDFLDDFANQAISAADFLDDFANQTISAADEEAGHAAEEDQSEQLILP